MINPIPNGIFSPYITPKMLPKLKHNKSQSSSNSNQNIKRHCNNNCKDKTRNQSSSLKASKTDTTAHNSDTINNKKNNTIISVSPFSFLDPPKGPSTTKSKVHHIDFSSPQSPSLTNDTLDINSLFKMKDYHTNLYKYTKTKSKITRQKEDKPKLNKLIYCEMQHNFIDRNILVKSSKDKIVELEAKEAKIKMRFWKGVFDSSYPKIVIKKIEGWKQEKNKTVQSIHFKPELKRRLTMSSLGNRFNCNVQAIVKNPNTTKYGSFSLAYNGMLIDNCKENINPSIANQMKVHKRSKALYV